MSETPVQNPQKPPVPPKVTYRLRYTKEEGIRFVGHLDMMRLLQRAARMAELPLAYSAGFNPHPLISLSAPLPLGMTSGGEYADMTLTGPFPEGEALERLNRCLPRGVHMLGVTRLKPKAVNVMACVAAARYRLACPAGTPLDKLAAALPAYLAQTEIWVEKTTKRKTETVDVRPDIFELKVTEDGLELLLAAGASRTLKAALAVENFFAFAGVELDWLACRCCRVDLLRQQEETLLPLDRGEAAEEFGA